MAMEPGPLATKRRVGCGMWLSVADMINFSIVPKWFIFWLITFALLLALSPRQAYACSCVVPGPPADEMAQASAVFAGKVIDWQFPDSPGSSIDPVYFTLAVSRVWKGPAFAHLTVRTAMSGASCGYIFQSTQEYLVYAYGEEDDLQVGLCSRTKLIASAEEDLSALGEETLPIEKNSTQRWLYLPQIP